MNSTISTKNYLSPLDAIPQMDDEIPIKYEGYMLKRRKWPLKGWHKRFFVLEKGFMKYAKSPHDILKGKLHGMMDVGLSVMSTKKKACRIDLDAEETIFHLKMKSGSLFQTWVTQLRAHREYRQAEMKNDTTIMGESGDGVCISPTIIQPSSSEVTFNTAAEECADSLSNVRNDIENLKKILDAIKNSPTMVVTPTKVTATQNIKDQSKKERKLSKKASKKLQKAGSSSVAVMPPAIEHPLSPGVPNDGFKVPDLPIQDQMNLSKSNPDLSTTTHASTNVSHSSLRIERMTPTRPSQLSKSVHSTPTHGLSSAPTFSFHSLDDSNNNHSLIETNKQEQFVDAAMRVTTVLESTFESISLLEQKQNAGAQSDNFRKIISQLTKENKDVMKENKELKTKMQMIQQISSFGLLTGVSPITTLNQRKNAIHHKVLSQMSSDSQLSISETVSDLFYDAEEYLLSDEESSTDGEMSENGDEAMSTDTECSEGESTSIQSMPFDVDTPASSGRRTRLPCPRPEGGDFSLWTILRKNIGKDLSRVAMPVTMNEPLNALQCLCEELEYSDLLDKAVLCEDPYDRMVTVAAFAISAYASTYTRAGQKPFNPLLGETYECVRDDRGFKFIAEQVSHHPPISVCYCQSNTYEFWQDARWKNKFWGKSMEILPVGSVHLKIPKYGDEYSWNKVTTCVHNIMSGTRWVEHYGEMIITNKDITCKIVFSKSGYWNSKNGEVAGTVTDGTGEAKQHLHGRWFESLYSGVGNKASCIWRKSAMPNDYEKYYGFTQFAMELNELEPSDENSLPQTDTRFRPDQRHLEEGNIDTAENEKQRIEQLQRDRKKKKDEEGKEYTPLFFKKIIKDKNKNHETWEYTGEYWTIKKDPGFGKYQKLPSLFW